MLMAAGVQTARGIIVYDSSTIMVNQVIPDNNLSGISSTFTVGEDTGIDSLSYVQLHLNISGGFDGDLYAYLTHNGQTAILLNRIGTSGADAFGSSQAGMNILLNDSIGANNIHTAGILVSGTTYQSDGRYASPIDLVGVNAAGTGDNLDNFFGQSASGDWTLFIADADKNGVATLDSWELEIAEVPEPVNVAMVIFATGFVLAQSLRCWKRRIAGINSASCA
jgi:subtilisin-like proprotein convertase family protein